MNANKIIKLSANENVNGCSDKVLQAIEKHYKKIPEYPEMNPILLKEKIAAKHHVAINNVIIGPGSVSLINNIILAFSNPGEEIITFEKSFIAYSQLSAAHARKCLFAAMKELRCVPENIFPIITNNAKIIFLANPNNPTGTIISHKELENLLNTIPSDIIVVHDEAYSEYVFDATFPDSIELLKKYKNLVVLHSFSKIYGLAGLRAGYLIGHEDVIDKLNKIHVPYSLNYLTSCAAIAALEDENFVKKSAEENLKEALYLHEKLESLGYNTIRSNANFVYVWFSENEEKLKIINKLKDAGILICDLSIFGQDKSIRIGIADRKVNSQIIDLLK